MELLNEDHIKELSQKTGEICISIYMPTHPTGREQQQDPIRLKNLLAQVSDRLEDRGMRRPEIEAFLAPAEGLLGDKRFWQHQSDGLSIFIGTDIFETYRLPVKFKQLLVIGENFHLKPILPLLTGDERFYVLALSQNEIRLLHGNRFNITEVNLEDVPTSLKEALWFDDPERQLQFHTGTAAPGRPGARPSVFHGHGSPDEDSKTELLRYFQRVNRGIMDLIPDDDRALLVLAGVDYLLPIYKEANDYPHLVEEAIKGNPDELSNKELHQEAWKLIEPVFLGNRREAIARYKESRGSGRALVSNQLHEIVLAAHHGRVETLFVALDVQIWGTYDENKAAVDQHQEFQPGDRDLLDLAAVQTLLNGGQVYVLKPAELEEQDIAAIFRYSY